MNESKDWRRYQRIPLSCVVHLRRTSIEETGIPEQAFVENLSRSGVFIARTKPFQAGAVIEFEIQLSGEEQRLSVVGIVRWCRERTEPGMGVELVQVTSSNRLRLAKYIESHIS